MSFVESRGLQKLLAPHLDKLFSPNSGVLKLCSFFLVPLFLSPFFFPFLHSSCVTRPPTAVTMVGCPVHVLKVFAFVFLFVPPAADRTQNAEIHNDTFQITLRLNLFRATGGRLHAECRKYTTILFKAIYD
jgi:hypothetical protein